MAVVTAAAHKTLAKLFNNEIGFAKLTYDFANDGSATADTVKLATATDKIMIINAVAQVETACTSGGSAVVNLGILGGDVDAFIANTAGAVASLTDDATIKETAGQKIVLADNDTISLSVATAALTAGKINLFIQYVNVV